MAKVALIRCDAYNEDTVRNAVERGLSLLGGPDRFSKKGEKILLKPNLLAGDPPEKCVTTNPNVFKAVAEIFMTTGAKISYGDSPALGSPKGAAKKSGLSAVADQLDIELADFKSGKEIFLKMENITENLRLRKGFWKVTVLSAFRNSKPMVCRD